MKTSCVLIALMIAIPAYARAETSNDSIGGQVPERKSSSSATFSSSPNTGKENLELEKPINASQIKPNSVENVRAMREWQITVSAKVRAAMSKVDAGKTPRNRTSTVSFAVEEDGRLSGLSIDGPNNTTEDSVSILGAMALSAPYPVAPDHKRKRLSVRIRLNGANETAKINNSSLDSHIRAAVAADEAFPSSLYSQSFLIARSKAMEIDGLGAEGGLTGEAGIQSIQVRGITYSGEKAHVDIMAQRESGPPLRKTITLFIDSHNYIEDIDTNTVGKMRHDGPMQHMPTLVQRYKGIIDDKLLRSKIFYFDCKFKGISAPLKIDDNYGELRWQDKMYSIQNQPSCAKYGWHAEGKGVAFDFCTATQGFAQFDFERYHVECQQKE